MRQCTRWTHPSQGIDDFNRMPQQTNMHYCIVIKAEPKCRDAPTARPTSHPRPQTKYGRTTLLVPECPSDPGETSSGWDITASEYRNPRSTRNRHRRPDIGNCAGRASIDGAKSIPASNRETGYPCSGIKWAGLGDQKLKTVVTDKAADDGLMTTTTIVSTHTHTDIARTIGHNGR
jgi:hypothetical protein